ncbi:flavin reductase family protein [Paraburkholderia sp. MMS20-SJTR3]|uniref:Flavin reductase family protein n=1 Tax=Paraburkholderia sejongensis TaxID=2886946 RepID=A0ABS8K185_9BURK|nr:flavin reductase family protein [Paraburkholderia sp. MMS20-SJTR3]MCC8395915.1 flavin reductase family protein [Paraburkholderia sp. MMS20-SJTR3]
MSDDIAMLFRRLTSGVYVIGVADGERRNAFTASSVMQVSFAPLLVALTIGPEHKSYELLRRGAVFGISVLRAEQQPLAAHFGTQSGRSVDKLASIRWRAGITGAPLLVDALAHFDCRVVDDVAAGDHRLVIGRVVDGALVAPDGPPLIYAQTGNLDNSAELFPDSFD